MHEVLVNRLGGLSLPRKSVVRLTDRPDMTLAVYRGRKTTMHVVCNLYINKYSFHKKLGLRLATNYSWCLLNKPLHILKADTKIFIGGLQAKMRGAGFIPFLGWNTIKTPLNQRPFIQLYLATHSAILLRLPVHFSLTFQLRADLKLCNSCYCSRL